MKRKHEGDDSKPTKEGNPNPKKKRKFTHELYSAKEFKSSRDIRAGNIVDNVVQEIRTKFGENKERALKKLDKFIILYVTTRVGEIGKILNKSSVIRGMITTDVECVFKGFQIGWFKDEIGNNYLRISLRRAKNYID